MRRPTLWTTILLALLLTIAGASASTQAAPPGAEQHGFEWGLDYTGC